MMTHTSARHLDLAALARGDSLSQQRPNRFDRTQLATLELLDQVLQRHQSARHAQAKQVTADPPQCPSGECSNHGNRLAGATA
jgi:hypothetical protein